MKSTTYNLLACVKYSFLKFRCFSFTYPLMSDDNWTSAQHLKLPMATIISVICFSRDIRKSPRGLTARPRLPLQTDPWRYIAIAATCEHSSQCVNTRPYHSGGAALTTRTRLGHIATIISCYYGSKLSRLFVRFQPTVQSVLLFSIRYSKVLKILKIT
jgi:hypothetical protein